jgi:alkanesulfonate monooxygenase SsuD/methylene tetrahydromethanopterin reductase-like flavin-dependent oxidoreductase (luciferase family)
MEVRHMPALDFGWVTQPAPRPNMTPADLHEYNRTALGRLSGAFSTVWVEDHFQWEMRPTVEAFVTLAYLAAEFPQYRYGSMVFGQSYRNPALLAKMAATLQYLSGGRFILGIGAGWKLDEYLAYGYPYPAAGVRIAQLAETIEIARALWTRSPATFKGQHYSIEDAYCEPRPSPVIPIHVGGGGEKGTLRVVARLADGWNFNFGTADELRHKLEVLQGHCQEIGRDIGEIALTYYGVVDLPEDPAHFTPNPNAFVLGPTPADAIRQIQEFTALGVSHVLVRTTSIATLERFRDEVIPVLTGT